MEQQRGPSQVLIGHGGARAAQRIGVRPETLYPWLQGKSRPKDVGPIIAFLDSVPADRLGIMPTGYEYREYKNWRGIPKPRRYQRYFNAPSRLTRLHCLLGCKKKRITAARRLSDFEELSRKAVLFSIKDPIS